MTAHPGFGCCPECSGRVLFALAVTGDVMAFDAAFEDGPFVIGWDITQTPRCRPVSPSGRTREGEHRYAPHNFACPALAPVVSITTAPSLRPVPKITGGRRASAR
jgi:hypothetical protein